MGITKQEQKHVALFVPGNINELDFMVTIFSLSFHDNKNLPCVSPQPKKIKYN